MFDPHSPVRVDQRCRQGSVLRHILFKTIDFRVTTIIRLDSRLNTFVRIGQFCWHDQRKGLRQGGIQNGCLKDCILQPTVHSNIVHLDYCREYSATLQLLRKHESTIIKAFLYSGVNRDNMGWKKCAQFEQQQENSNSGLFAWLLYMTF